MKKLKCSLISLLAALGLASTAAAQTNANNTAGSVTPNGLTNSVWADLGKIGSDLGSELANLTSPTLVSAGGGINTATRTPVYAAMIAFPASDKVYVGAVGAYIGSTFYEGGLNLSYNAVNKWPVLGEIRSAAGDGPVWNFKRNAAANYLFTSHEKWFVISKKLSAEIGVCVANTSDMSGVDIIGGGGLQLTW